MKALLAIEWLKIKRYRTVWVLTSLFLGFILLFNILIATETLTLGGKGINILNSDYTFSGVWLNTTYWTKAFAGLIALMVIILTTNEYQYRTNRQNVIDGWQRSQFFHAKWLLVLVLGMVVTLFTFATGIIFGLLNGSSLSDAGTHIEKLFYLFILLLNYCGVALTLSFFLKRTGLAIVIFILYAYPLENILWGISLNPNYGNFGFFTPMESSAGLLMFPFPPAAKEALPKHMPSDSSYLAASLAYIAFYYLLGRWKLLKGDW
ncbi:MAG: ABC transporter permease [Flavipsychrobacter sp.]|nr:ABC transporter permease [Flavipsychrobacter sp.]